MRVCWRVASSSALLYVQPSLITVLCCRLPFGFSPIHSFPCFFSTSTTPALAVHFLHSPEYFIALPPALTHTDTWKTRLTKPILKLQNILTPKMDLQPTLCSYAFYLHLHFACIQASVSSMKQKSLFRYCKLIFVTHLACCRVHPPLSLSFVTDCSAPASS